MSVEASQEITGVKVLILNLAVNDERSANDGRLISQFWENRRCVVRYNVCPTLAEMRQRLGEFSEMPQSMYVINILSYTSVDQWQKPDFCTEDGHRILLSDLHDYIHNLPFEEINGIPKFLFHQFYEKENTRPRTWKKVHAVISRSFNLIFSPSRSSLTGPRNSTRQLSNILECYALEPKSRNSSGESWFIKSLVDVLSECRPTIDIQMYMLLIQRRMASLIRTHPVPHKYMSTCYSNLSGKFHLTTKYVGGLEAFHSDSSPTGWKDSFKRPSPTLKRRHGSRVPSLDFEEARTATDYDLIPSAAAASARVMPRLHFQANYSFQQQPANLRSRNHKYKLQALRHGSDSSTFEEPIIESSEFNDPESSSGASSGTQEAFVASKSHSTRHKRSSKEISYRSHSVRLPVPPIWNTHDSKEIQEHLTRAATNVDRLRRRIKIESMDNAEMGNMYCELCASINSFRFSEVLYGVALDGLSVIEYPLQTAKEIMTLLELHCYAGEACSALQRLDDVLTHIKRFEETVDANPNLGSPPQYEKLQERKDYLKGIAVRRMEINEKLKAKKLIDKHGGIISSQDATVTFSEGSVENSTIIHIETTAPILGEMDQEFVPVSPILKLSPCMALMAPVKVTLSTWIDNQDDSDIQAKVFYKKSDSYNWEFDQSVSIGNNGKASFDVKNFCIYGLFIKALMKWNFQVKSCLFVNTETKKLTNRLVLNCSTCKEDLIKEMSYKNFKQICSMDPTLVTNIGDEVKVSIRDIRDDHEYENPRPKSALITRQFLGGGDHELQDYLLPRQSKGIVEFNHEITLLRDGNVEKFIKHEADRTNLDQLNAPRSYTSAGIVVGAPGATITASRGIEVRQQLGN